MINVNHLLAGFPGSDDMFRHRPSGFIYTGGVQLVAERFECYWLIDAIFSHQLSEIVQGEDFQVWKLKREQGYKFTLVCEDGNDNFITEQEIEFSDFVPDTVTFYFVDETLLLPCEY